MTSPGSRKVVQRFLLIWLVLIFLLAVVLGLLYRAQVKSALTIIKSDEQQAIQLARHSILSDLGMLHSDVLYLSRQSSMMAWLDTPTPETRAHLAEDMLAFARFRGLYDQVRFLDVNGREVVRINWNRGNPGVVPVQALQNKSTRYYVRNAFGLSSGQIYVSPFDLNIENNVIEQPIKPTIRLGTPVFDRSGHKRGLIILNYLGQLLLQRLRTIPSNGAKVWLINSQGYWLLGPRPEMEWGFMYPERKEISFAHTYGDAWRYMQERSEGTQFRLHGDLYTFTKMSLTGVSGDQGNQQWVLVSRVAHDVLGAKLAVHSNSFWISFAILAVLLALLSGLVAYYGIHREQSQEKVRNSEARFRGLLDAAPDAIITVNQNGYITLANPQAENWFGYSRDELRSMTVEALVPERFRGRHDQDREHYFSNPIARPMGAGLELFGLRKDGSEFPVEISLSPQLQSDEPEVISIVRDITVRKQIEESQRQVRARYQELVNNLPVGVYRNTTGPEGRFLEVNAAMVEMFEAESQEQLFACPVRDLYCNPEERQALSEKIMREGFVSGEELHLKTLRGREFCAAITAVVRKDANGNPYFDGIVEDITDRKESELRISRLNDSLQQRTVELEATNKELEAFSYAVSHDLRAPLRSIDGFSRILMDEFAGQLDDKGRDRLTRVRNAAQHMAALIDDLLKLSRVTRADLAFEPVDMSALAKNVLDEFRKAEPERNVEVRVQPELNVRGDARLLRVVLDNLVGNAWKFTSAKPGARIEIGVAKEDDENVYYVRDNGAGFDMAYAGKLFGAFQRLHDASEFPGTGIGLATVQRVIHKHGGRIWAESTPGEGATFYFTLGQGESA